MKASRDLYRELLSYSNSHMSLTLDSPHLCNTKCRLALFPGTAAHQMIPNSFLFLSFPRDPHYQHITRPKGGNKGMELVRGEKGKGGNKMKNSQQLVNETRFSTLISACTVNGGETPQFALQGQEN